MDVKEFIKTLTPITDYTTLKMGDKIFSGNSLSVDYIDTFDHMERWSDDREILFYKNYKGETWWLDTKYHNWYYLK